MKVGDLVKRRDDPTYHGIVVEVGPQETATDHGETVVRAQWNDGEVSYEFVKMLEVLSEGR
tara:strand:- start:38 stop:220 length:183 start_codon:yes stop_codon:yes gene_type:complete